MERWRSTGIVNQTLANDPSSEGDKSEISIKSALATSADVSAKISKTSSISPKPSGIIKSRTEFTAQPDPYDWAGV